MDSGKAKDVRKQNMLITLIIWLVLACGLMGAMMYVAARKTIVIADTVREESSLPEGSQGSGAQELVLRSDGMGNKCIQVALAKGTKAENVVMENRYMERELWIYLKEAEADFYQDNAIYGDLAPVLSGQCETGSDGIVLKFSMDGVWEYRSTMENDALVIAYHEPGELYEQIVVVDPVGGGSESGVVAGGYAEKDITLQVAKQLQKNWVQENIRIYFTRQEDVDVSLEERLAFTEEVGADMFIAIGACGDTEHPEYYGIHSFYNEEYFIPEFGNIQLADVLTRSVTLAASNRAIGLTPAETGSILRELEIPAAEICVGYMTNTTECALLQQEDYHKKLAEGLANAILEVYTNEDANSEVGE